MEKSIPEESIAALVRKAKRGDESALSHIFAYFHEDIRKMLTRRGIHPNDREDALQACFICIHMCVIAYNPRKGPFENYVRASIYKDLRHGRGFSVRQGLPTEPLNGHDFPTESSEPTEVTEMLTALAPAQRSMVEAYFGIKGPERTLAEIAVMQKLPYRGKGQCVQKEFQEALATLRKMLE